MISDIVDEAVSAAIPGHAAPMPHPGPPSPHLGHPQGARHPPRATAPHVQQWVRTG